MTLRAAFIVAFFASFFSHGQSAPDPFADGTIDLQPPTSSTVYKFNCVVAGNGDFRSGPHYSESSDPTAHISSCIAIGQHHAEQVPEDDICKSNSISYVIEGATLRFTIDVKKWKYNTCGSYESHQAYHVQQLGTDEAQSCPPNGFPRYISTHHTGDDSFMCFDPSQHEQYLLDQAESKSVDDFCKRLVLDSGNNSAGSMCYTAPSGVSCNVSRQSVGDTTYYSGTGQNIEGCSSSDDLPYDNSGTGEGNDGCFSSGGTNYCEANKNKHCTSVQGSQICDDGCFETQAGFYCDAAKHPDVGEGDSDYFDSQGTCSVVAGSAYKGVCEELGGTWDKSGDYTDTSCPATSISGSCSVGTNGGCFACLDAGGTWTPDPNAPLNNTEKGIQDVASLTQDTNDKLKTLELTNRKGNEALVSTIKSTNDKILSELKVLSGKGSGGVGAVVAKLDELKEEEKEPYTTTTDTNDRSLINGLFSAQKIAEVKASSEQIKTDIQTFISTSKAELSTLLTISAPSSSGYQARSVDIKGSSFNLSLSRFSEYFGLLAGPVMLICSIIALFIILGRNS